MNLQTRITTILALHWDSFFSTAKLKTLVYLQTVIIQVLVEQQLKLEL